MQCRGFELNTGGDPCYKLQMTVNKKGLLEKNGLKKKVWISKENARYFFVMI